MKPTLLAALLAAGTLVSAHSFAAPGKPFYNNGDENDPSSWIYTPTTAKPFFADTGKPAVAIKMPHNYDMDDTSWEYQPAAKQFPADTGAPATVLANIPHVGDEDDLSWMYVPASARAFAQGTMHADSATAVTR